MALFRSLVNFSSPEYSGSTRVLKHVWAVGRWSVSGPARWICSGRGGNFGKRGFHSRVMISLSLVLLALTRPLVLNSPGKCIQDCAGMVRERPHFLFNNERCPR